jgi:hypothetical protein
MKRLVTLFLCLLMADLSCSLQPVPTHASPTAGPPTGVESQTPLPQTQVVRRPDLTHTPLYWFAPLPPLPVVPGRPFIGSEDFLQLFDPNAAWQTASGRIQVFKLYGEWVSNHPADAALKQVVADLSRRGLAIAIETGPLDPDPDCGNGIEGFATVASSLQMARDIKAAGGTLDLIALDEPDFFASLYDGPNACHWTSERVAREVDEFIQAVRGVFPNVIVGDTEPLAGAGGAQQYQDWLDTFREENGYPLAFLHLDIDWSRPHWPDEVKAIQQHGTQIGVAVGIIYNGNAFDKTDADFLAAAGERVKRLELGAGVQPDHVLFQSWTDKPDRALPETETDTFTGFIDRYFTDKSSLGYPREGQGANIALGKAVRYSGQVDGMTGDFAVDGDFGTLWNSGGGPLQWMEIDLGKSYDILEIRLTVSQFPDGETAHRILGKGAAGDYSLLTTLKGKTTDGQTLIFRPALPAQGLQFIRVETVESPSWVSWREIEIINAGQ